MLDDETVPAHRYPGEAVAERARALLGVCVGHRLVGRAPGGAVPFDECTTVRTIDDVAARVNGA